MENQTTSNAPNPDSIFKLAPKHVCWWCKRKCKSGFHEVCWKEFKGWMLK